MKTGKCLIALLLVPSLCFVGYPVAADAEELPVETVDEAAYASACYAFEGLYCEFDIEVPFSVSAQIQQNTSKMGIGRVGDIGYNYYNIETNTDIDGDDPRPG